MPVRGSLSPCPFCDGQGLLTFERGPEVEPCTECKGTGRVYSDPAYKGLFAELLRQKGLFLAADMRLLLLGLDALDERLGALEDDAHRSS
jgi:hypothetical protein